MSPGLAKPSRMPQTHVSPFIPDPTSPDIFISLIFALSCLYTFALHHCSWFPRYLLVFLKDN